LETVLPVTALEEKKHEKAEGGRSSGPSVGLSRQGCSRLGLGCAAGQQHGTGSREGHCLFLGSWSFHEDS